MYKELQPFYNVHATYRSSNRDYDSNQKFHQWDAETESIEFLLKNLKPDIIISALRGEFNALIKAHQEIISYVAHHDSKIIFLSSANVYDAFTNFPSYEFDKTFSYSVFGRFKIQIENAIMRLSEEKFNILRLPMIFGLNSPRVEELKTLYSLNEPIEVFPNVVINANTLSKLSQQIHYLINREFSGIYHLGSTDLIHHSDLIKEILEKLNLENPKITRVYESNDVRYLAILPKVNRLPKHLEITIEEVIKDSVIFSD